MLLEIRDLTQRFDATTVLDRLGIEAPADQYEGVPLGQEPTTPIHAWRCAPQSLTVETALWENDLQAIRIRRWLIQEA